ncbi:RNB domain-containing ribonuclease [Desulfococcaceae bacterium HSG9]|nr:RNB domain-containing ribonuclease [Desulfococcaceae bacterium HSG9]
MEAGNVVEYIDAQKIVCAVVIEVKKQRLRLLTETDREVNLSEKRLVYKGNRRTDLSKGRTHAVNEVKKISDYRKGLIDSVDIAELWDVLNSEQEWIDLETMTEFCFPDNPDYDHQAAVVRAFFYNRRYFRFNQNSFFPYSQEQVDLKIKQDLEAARINRIIEEGGGWLQAVLKEKNRSVQWDKNDANKQEYINILKSVYLYEKESKHYQHGKKMLSRAGIGLNDDIFALLVKLGIFKENENINLYRFDIPIQFNTQVRRQAKQVSENPANSSQALSAGTNRRDLTMLASMTIDGQSTLDFDDAISIEDNGDYYRLGVHIVDVGHFIKNDDALDKAALTRASSIYMPDQKISMLPAGLSEELCSLKEGVLRPAISTMIKISPLADPLFRNGLDYEIVPSLIRVKHQLTYHDVNLMADSNKDIIILHKIARHFRDFRMAQQAIQIALPEVNIWLDEDEEIIINRINRESPARMIVSEIMIMANWLMARNLASNKMPAVFRSQPEPRERISKGDESTLFENLMQRRALSRFVLSTEPGRHAGLGLDCYVTATSPIRKYYDLITQRQIRATLGLEAPGDAEKINNRIQMLQEPMRMVALIQRSRSRYWLLKYLEKLIGQQEKALVLYCRRNSVRIMIIEYMLECDLPLTGGMKLKPEDQIDVKIQHVDAHRDVLAVYLC